MPIPCPGPAVHIDIRNAHVDVRKHHVDTDRRDAEHDYLTQGIEAAEVDEDDVDNVGAATTRFCFHDEKF